MRLTRVAGLIGLGLIVTAGWLGEPSSASRREPATQLPIVASAHGPLPAQVSVCFVPAQQCDVMIAGAIGRARESIRVQAYGFTSPIILNALGDARTRGVDVQVILDKSNDPFQRSTRREADGGPPRLRGAAFTSAANIPTWIDHSVAIAHNKIMIIDARTVIGGSYNFTASAEQRNAENVTVIDSASVANLYLTNWESRKAAARLYVPPASNSAYGGSDLVIHRPAQR